MKSIAIYFKKVLKFTFKDKKYVSHRVEDLKKIFEAVNPFVLATRQQEDYKLVFGSAEGKRVLADILKDCMHGETAYSPHSERETNINLGRQLVGLNITKKLNVDLIKEEVE